MWKLRRVAAVVAQGRWRTIISMGRWRRAQCLGTGKLCTKEFYSTGSYPPLVFSLLFSFFFFYLFLLFQLLTLVAVVVSHVVIIFLFTAFACLKQDLASQLDLRPCIIVFPKCFCCNSHSFTMQQTYQTYYYYYYNDASIFSTFLIRRYNLQWSF